MIGPTGAVRVMVATKPVDFRKGSDGLAALVREIMRADPFDGAIYVFRAKRADRLKLLLGRDGSVFVRKLPGFILRLLLLSSRILAMSYDEAPRRDP